MRSVLQEFHRLREAQKLTCDVARGMARRAVDRFLERCYTSDTDVSEAITLLCELATDETPALAQIGVQGLFPLLVERLGDAFTPAACSVYNRLFTQVIQHCRQLPAGQAFDRQLRYFGLFTQADLLARAQRVRRLRRFARGAKPRISKALVLSRVTLGADIAVTSVVLAALKQAFPTAEIGLVADTKALELFAGDPCVRLCAIRYPRGGGLFERLTSWLRTIETVQYELQGLRPEEYVIVDPDSRLTQLGLLPLVAEDCSYLFFESRSYAAPGPQTIGALTSHWLQHVFRLEDPVYPYCAPGPADVMAARKIVRAAKERSTHAVISVNFGVGANPAKRLPDPFEYSLLRRLLRTGKTVILDQGGDSEEAARIGRLIAALQQDGFPAMALDAVEAEDGSLSDLAGARLLTWHGSIGRLAALIAESDAYIGYDSAGQHIAAALEVPTIDLFTGFTSPRMPERWAPYGRGPVRVLVCDAANADMAGLEAIIDEVLTLLPGV